MNTQPQESRRVAVQIGTMDSIPGYQSSSGTYSAVIVPAEEAAKNRQNLYEWSRMAHVQRVTLDMLETTTPENWRRGACDYRTTKGTLIPPEDTVVIQRVHLSICTKDRDIQTATILNERSLRLLYHSLGAFYNRCAEACDS